MKKEWLICWFCLWALAACSTYKTSSNDISFTGTKFYEQPVLPLGDQGLDNQEMRFLGWIESYVLSPSVFKAAPTKQQVNYVLAHQAKQQGADAVLHISYKESFSVTGKTRLTAKGQAIKIRANEDSQSKLAAEDKQQPTHLPSSVAIDTTPIPLEQQADSNEDVNAAFEENTVTSSDLILERQAEVVKAEPPRSALVLKEEKAEAKNRSGMQLIIHLNQFYDDEMNRMQLMHNNAAYLKQQAQKYNDKAMLNAAERLLEQLEQQQQAFQGFAP